MKKIPVIFKFVLLALVVFRVFSNSLYGTSFEWLKWVRTSLYGFFAIIAFFTSKIPLKTLKKLSFIIVLGLCFVFLALIPNSAENFSNYKFDFKLLLENLLYIFRLAVTTFSAIVVFETTSNLEIFDTFENIENAIAKIFPFIKKAKVAQIIAITIVFIPAIFDAWEKISLAAKARLPKQKKHRLSNSICNAISQFYELFLYMIQYAENVRKAIENRSTY